MTCDQCNMQRLVYRFLYGTAVYQDCQHSQHETHAVDIVLMLSHHTSIFSHRENHPQMKAREPSIGTVIIAYLQKQCWQTLHCLLVFARWRAPKFIL